MMSRILMLLACLVITPNLAVGQDAAREKYNEYAEACRTEEGTDGSNPCRDALWYYGGHISQDNLEEPLTLLKENCNDNGKITGCEPLSDIYDGDEMLFADGTRKAWPKEPEKALEVLITGCVATLEAVGNCGSLGLYHEEKGDFARAAHYYELGCDTGMRAASDEYFGQERVCYWAAKNARDNIQDYANARRWFNYTCYNSADPFACKFLGLMYDQAEGGEKDPVGALNLYERGCYLTEDITTGDGQSCFLLGQSLVSLRDDVASGNGKYGYQIATAEDGPADTRSQYNLTAASRAFLRGCMDNRSEACKAHDDLLKSWSEGDYSRRSSECRIMDEAGRMAPDKACQSFPFFLAPPEGLGDTGRAIIFVWPDGDRTVTISESDTPFLNGAVGDWVLPEGGWECIRSTVTGRGFCYAPS